MIQCVVLTKTRKINNILKVVLTNFGPSSSGKTMAFGAIIPQVRILSAQFTSLSLGLFIINMENSGVTNDGVLFSFFALSVRFP